MNADDFIPSVVQIRHLCKHINDFIAVYHFSPAAEQTDTDRIRVFMSLAIFEAVTTSPPYFQGGIRTIRGWRTSGMKVAMEKLEVLSEVFRGRWNLASVADLPSGGGNRMPDTSLEVDASELERLAKIAAFFEESLKQVPPPRQGTPSFRIVADTDDDDEFSGRQTRLKADTDDRHPHFILDGKVISCRSDAAVHFVAALIEADGHVVPFTEWKNKHPKFADEQSNRVLDALPSEVAPFIERKQGKPPRLKVELLNGPSDKA